MENNENLQKSNIIDSKSEMINVTTDRIELNSDLQIENSPEKNKLPEETTPQNIPSTFLTHANIKEEKKEEKKEEEEKKLKEKNENEEEEEEKLKQGEYYFPMIINRRKKESYNSSSFLIKHPQKEIDTSKKLNFKTNPGLFKGPVRLSQKRIKDYTNINDLLYFLHSMVHMPIPSKKIVIPYDNFRERMKVQYLSRNQINYGNHNYMNNNIIYHSYDSNYRENKLIKARNIAMTKLPKIKSGYNYPSESNIHRKGKVKLYKINKP